MFIKIGYSVLYHLGGCLTVLGRWAFTLSGYMMDRHLRKTSVSKVPKGGDRIFPETVNDGYPQFPKSQIIPTKVERLIDFVAENQIDTLIIFGCAYGRELFPFAERYFSEDRPLKIIGADLSDEALEGCREAVKSKKFSWLKFLSFENVNIEDTDEVKRVLEIASGRVGVYICETSHYIFPRQYKAFIATLGASDNVVAFQMVETNLIDSYSRYQTGMVFSYQKGFWRHNYPKIIEKHFTINKRFFFDPSRNSSVHLDQYYWFISASK